MDRAQFSAGAEAVLGRFYDISQIPRGSGNNAQISAYLQNFATSLGLESAVDSAGNVIVRKPAAAGCEAGVPVILEAHYDMVCERTPESRHDFSGPLELCRAGDKIFADGTTLGADNGLGVAAIMAVLAGDLPHPPLEAVFTSSEETDMAGARCLDMRKLKGKLLLTLDSHALLSSGAGEMDADLTLPMRKELLSGDADGVRLCVSGLRGGHSGANAMDEPGNAIMLLARTLRQLEKTTAFSLADLSGGTQTSSAFARQASAVLAIRRGQLQNAAAAAEKMQEQFNNELQGRCEGVTISVLPCAAPETVFCAQSTKRLMDLLTLLPDGVHTRNHEYSGAMESSCNCGVVKMENTCARVNVLVRTTCESRREELLEKLRVLAELLGAELTIRHILPAWQTRIDPPILRLAKEIYEMEPELTPATLECGVFQSKKPELDLLGVGIPYYYQHSPAEYALVSETATSWKKLLRFLAALGRGV